MPETGRTVQLILKDTKMCSTVSNCMKTYYRYKCGRELD
jgi:hypothetical protein